MVCAINDYAMNPNNFQKAVALISLSFINVHRKQAHVIPGGQGKSRVAAMIAFIALKSRKYEKVKMIYSSDRLKDKDKNDFANLFKTVNLDDKIVYTTDLSSASPSDKELLIMDEGDEFIFRDPKTTYDIIKEFDCIMLTATIDGGDQLQTEGHVLEEFGFRKFDHSLACMRSLAEDIIYTELAFNSNQEILNYMETQKRSQAMLVYGK
jgi:hypothetical protein